MSVGAHDSFVQERAYASLQHGALIVDRSDRLRMQFAGDKAAETLTGLVTNDVVALTPGHGQYAAALTPKGKVLADLRIFRRDDGLLVDVAPAAAPGFAAMIRKFVNPRLSKYQDISEQTGDLGVFGSAATEVIRSSFPGAGIFTEMPSYAHGTFDVEGTTVTIARVPDFGVTGYDIIGPRDALGVIRSRLLDSGAMEDGTDALRIARIEAGRPEWGVDMDDSLLAQELDMDRLGAISYTKGCYTGQETVARVHFRGHVNRSLQGLRLNDALLPPAGTELQDGDGKVVGVVKSGAVSPRFGAIALAIVRREIEPGGVLRASWPDHSVEARVDSLPFHA
jgi:folate-binding protein YgfZ